MLEQIILGIIQGITEWLPISSEGLIFLAEVNLFGKTGDFSDLAKTALLLHLGTFFAALIYFWSDIGKLWKTLLSYKSANSDSKKILNFLVVSTVVTGIVSVSLIKFFTGLEFASLFLNILIALMLIVTGLVQITSSKSLRLKSAIDLKSYDSILLGVVQGFSVLPGLSRSGITVSTLLLRKFNDIDALRLSFLMSLPVVLLGNIILNWGELSFSYTNLAGIFFSFLFGLATIKILMGLAKKINFGYFVIIFGLLVLAAVFV